ncbi:FAD-dependent monooxygenase [Cupriavidus sp. CV2]|uniref:FAD-dependent monooxygenase n=1 Tax=Cupriavidus ulmosensis TaxID=3065913 RepID=UPI00296AE933|nr:FAD-dependent monooxygenase [Cupriavidus sp. CV2]MDW3684517.1 FAD-dependent monooxygenase [Cupriavidus sp. CV2]
MKTVQTDVAIIGGGPAGLMLAIELGCRNVRCVLLEDDLDPPAFPKANATSSRTMEHYRRRGFAQAIRALGLPPAHPQDVVYRTQLCGVELARFKIPSREQARSRASVGDYGDAAWPTPELPHRAQQMYIEPVLRQQAASYGSVQLHLGQQAMAVAQTDDGVTVDVMPADGGARWQVKAGFLVGCDGPRSLVRKSLGIAYSGQGGEQRDFFGGQMLSIYFRSRDLYAALGKDRAWQYWAVNAQQRGLLIAIDGVETFLLAIQLEAGRDAQDIDPAAVSRAVVGASFDFNLIAMMPWVAGYTLVADRMSSGRMFLAGDAAHLFTPTGGMGYNTSIDDAVNLGWKLAAVTQGAAPAALLDTYDAERRPIALRNTAFARRMADSIGNIRVGADVSEAGPAGESARAALGQALASHVSKEFNIPGLQLGVRYAGSPIVASDAAAPPPDDPNRYVPSAYPGARAPHAVVGGKVLFDLFGRDFTLLAFTQSDTGAWTQAAQRNGMQLDVVRVDDDAARSLYGAELVLIRPDHHVAWRGDASAGAGPVLALATGRSEAAAA